ncbi:hypothetical protein [Microlunatus spumicola]|uniref:hypothetical protein n=1 Tax=Microlunatus spumicola TaxID=81499 RepID=UPI00195B46C0
MAGGSALLKKRPLLLGGLVLLVALAIAVSLAVTRPWAGTKDRDDVAAPAPGDRVLQSVDVTMQGDGALTRVGDTVVVARAQGGRADTYSTTYDPTAVVDQLPVRVLTAYQTDQGSGTDLDDLKGYSGRVAIRLTVQNLTVRSQEITYDVAGRSQTTTALVGAPLTVVASAALPGIDPATVVTAPADAPADAGSEDGSTNGVLSKAADGGTQVQWASILAPPQLDPTATFRVVLDAKDLVVPTFDVSVQPGLVTDPSVGALIDAAFNPKNSDELALETRTIALIGDVNDVLGRASGTISSVRKTLDASSKTLGTKTVQSLTEDTKTISTSLKSSSDNIDSLGDDLKSSLQTTQSSTLERMSETVFGLQDLIGDTSASEPAVKTDGEGCETTVTADGAKGGVYGSLLAVTAQLDGYKAATDACKEAIQAEITSTIGPAVPDATSCPVDAETPAVTCSLARARERFAAVTASITASQDASKALDLTTLNPVETSIANLGKQLGTVGAATDALLDDDPKDGAPALARVDAALDDATTSLTSATGTLGDLTDAIDGVHGEAVANQKKVVSMRAQSGDLAAALCDVVGDGTQPGRLSAAQAESLRAYLVDEGCDGTTDLDPPAKWDTSLADRLDGQADAWATVAAALDTSSDDHAIGRRITDLTARLADLRTELRTASSDLDDNRKVLAEIDRDVTAAQASLKLLGTSVGGVQDSYAAAKEALDGALEQAAEQADKATSESLTADAIKRVADQGQTSSKELGVAFDESAKGLQAAADKLRDGTAKTLKQQQDDLADQEKADEAELTGKTKAGLTSISSSVTSATRDIDTTRTSLTKDLNNVLLDLGNPEQPGKGLLGTLGKSARSADSADYQLGLASDKTSAYASVRSQEVGGIMLRQAQAEAALQRQAELPAFATELPPTTTHRTIYLFHVGGDR